MTAPLLANTEAANAALELVYHEAALLDRADYDGWYALFADDGMYWVPLAYDQTDPVLHTSLAYEDKLLLKLRVERLKDAHSFSQHPKSRSLHVLQRPVLESADAASGEYVTSTNYMYTEVRGDEQQVYACTARHTLVSIDGTLRIRLKRVALLNCDAALPSIQLFV